MQQADLGKHTQNYQDSLWVLYTSHKLIGTNE